MVQLTNDSFCSIAPLAKLESLVMVGCPCVDDTGLRFLESGCPLLKVNSLHAFSGGDIMTCKLKLLKSKNYTLYVGF